MFKYQKDTAISTIITTVVTIIGTAAALSYYIAISKYNTNEYLTFILGSYFVLISTVGYIYNRRYEQNA